MLIEVPTYAERFGSVRINDLQRILELDSGRKVSKEVIGVHKVKREEMSEIERRLAVIVPIKNDKLKLIDGVFSGIPHDCFLIVVSNSRRKPSDRAQMEKDGLLKFCQFTQRKAIFVHQRDPAIAEAFKKVGYEEILDDKELVRDGKAEGMIIGIVLAKTLGKDFVGFIDGDNYVPGAVHEYVKDFVCGFSMAESPYVMVRNSWKYKPKVLGERVYFRKWGRISVVTNSYLNQLISTHSGFETEVIKTGNAGEHAMSMKLAEIMEYSSSYSVEPYELIYILEEFGGMKPTHFEEVLEEGVDIFQIETRNPHFHERKGEEHLSNMLLQSLSTIYNSELCTKEVKKAIIKEIKNREVGQSEKDLPELKKMPPLRDMKLKFFEKIRKENTIKS